MGGFYLNPKQVRARLTRSFVSRSSRKQILFCFLLCLSVAHRREVRASAMINEVTHPSRRLIPQSLVVVASSDSCLTAKQTLHK